jgi:hypothetical protein
MLNRALIPILFLALSWVFPGHAAERVLDFHSDIRVAKSGELTVTERITLEVDGKAMERTLMRDLPIRSRVVDVIRDGHPGPYTLDGNRLRIGGTPLSPGRHLYQITYRSARQIRFLEGHDELRWNLSGAERVTAEVTLPAAVPAREIKTEAAGGDYQGFVRDGRAAFRSKESITIVVRFPKGVIAEPGVAQRARWFFDDYKGFLLVLAGLALTAWVLVRLKKGSEQFSRR